MEPLIVFVHINMLQEIRGLIPEVLNIHIRSRFEKYDDQEFNLYYDEFLKFIYLFSKYGGGHLPVSQKIDDVWHEFILQTKEYEDLCFKLPGKNFIHHKSGSFESYLDQSNIAEVVKEQVIILPRYVHHFGKFTNDVSSIWFIVHYLITHLDMSLDSINKLALDETQQYS